MDFSEDKLVNLGIKKTDFSIKSTNASLPAQTLKLNFSDRNFSNKSIGTTIQFDEAGLKAVKSKTDNGLDLISYLDSENKLVKETTIDKNNSLSKFFADDGSLTLIETKVSNPESKTSEKAYFDSLESFKNQKPIKKVLNEGLPNQVLIDYEYGENIVKELRKSNEKSEYFEKGFQDDGKTLKYSFYELENSEGKFNEYNAFAKDGKTSVYQLCSNKIGNKEEISEKAFQEDGKTLKFEQYSTKTPEKTVSDRKDYRSDGKTLHSETHTESEKGRTTTDYKAYQSDGKTFQTTSRTVEEGGKTTKDTKNYQSDGKTLKSESHTVSEKGVTTTDVKNYQNDGKTLKSKTHSVTKDGETTSTVTTYAEDGKTVTSEKTTVTKEIPDKSDSTSSTKPEKPSSENNNKRPIDEIIKNLEDKFKNNPEKERILSNLKQSLTTLFSRANIKEPDSFINGVIRQIMTNAKTTPQNISAESFEKAYASFEQKFLLAQKELSKSTERTPSSIPEISDGSITNIADNSIENQPLETNTIKNMNSVLDLENDHPEPSKTVRELAKDTIVKENTEKVTKEEQEEYTTKPNDAEKAASEVENPSKTKPKQDAKLQSLLNSLATNPNIHPKTKETLLSYYNRTLLPYAEKHNIDKNILSEEFASQLQALMSSLEGNNSEKTLNKIERNVSRQMILSHNKRMLDKVINSRELNSSDISSIKDLTENPNTSIATQAIVLKNNENLYELTTATNSRLRFDIDKIDAVTAGKIPKEQFEKLVKLLALYSNDSTKDRKLQEFIGATLVANEYSSTKLNRERNIENNSVKYDPFSANNGI